MQLHSLKILSTILLEFHYDLFNPPETPEPLTPEQQSNYH